MQWGASEKWLQDCRDEDPSFDPPALRERPLLPEHLSFVWRAYGQLRSERNGAFGSHPIPWTALDAYARRYGIADIDEFDRLVAAVRAMETAEEKK